MESSIQLEYDFIGKNLFELYGSFHPIKPHNNLLVGLSLKNLYHNLFSDLDLEYQDRFYRNFRFECFCTIYDHVTSNCSNSNFRFAFKQVEGGPKLYIQTV